MAIAIAAETSLQDDVRRLVAALNAHLIPLTPREFQFQMTVEQMAGADTTVFIARDEVGAAVGCGALKVHDAATGEVKRMFTVPQERGRGIGSALLAAILELARRHKLSRLVLETGSVAAFADAWRLYERAGFTRCGAVLDYPDSGWSTFYEKQLEDETP